MNRVEGIFWTNPKVQFSWIGNPTQLEIVSQPNQTQFLFSG